MSYFNNLQKQPPGLRTQCFLFVQFSLMVTVLQRCSLKVFGGEMPLPMYFVIGIFPEHEVPPRKEKERDVEEDGAKAG